MIDPGLHTSSLSSLPLVYRGKVRDIYSIDENHWLIIATDRVSAFDVILPTVIPGKGKLLTELALFWFNRMSCVIDNHLVDIPLDSILTDPLERAQASDRCMIVKRLQPLPIEAVVRGYLAGSAWQEYQSTGGICNISLPAGLQQAQRLPDVLFTPATKAQPGDHDENISFEIMAEQIGSSRAGQVRDISVDIYRTASAYAETHGILIADTKFEFGLDQNDALVLMDEVLTPDSSRFWEADSWAPGLIPASYDKQYVRDYLETLDWDKADPGPELPPAVVAGTLARYQQAIERLAGSIH